MSQTTIDHPLKEFFTEFGDELDTCNYLAHDMLVEISQDLENTTLIEDFFWEYGDELDACNPDAFDLLMNIFKQLEIEVNY